jgi:hypothetical protein
MVLFLSLFKRVVFNVDLNYATKSSFLMDNLTAKFLSLELGIVVHAYNPNYSGNILAQPRKT